MHLIRWLERKKNIYEEKKMRTVHLELVKKQKELDLKLDAKVQKTNYFCTYCFAVRCGAVYCVCLYLLPTNPHTRTAHTLLNIYVMFMVS